jgi:predicted phosphohydrolase
MAAEAGPSAIVYGHLHGADPQRLPQAYRGIPLHLVAADALGFRPKMILEED